MPFPGYYDPTATQVTADRIAHQGLSSRLWRNVNQMSIMGNPGEGYFHLQRFGNWLDITTETTTAEATMGYLTGGQAVRATANYLGAEGPTLAVDSEGTDNQGVESLQFNGQLVTPKDGYDIIFEARVAVSTTTNAPSTIVGMVARADAAVLAINGGAIAADDWIGFTTAESLSCNFSVEDGTLSTSASAVHTFVDMATAADGKDWVKLGFMLRGTANTGEYYVNGALGSESITWTAGPNVALVPTFGCLSSGSASILRVHWFAVAQVPTEGK